MEVVRQLTVERGCSRLKRAIYSVTVGPLIAKRSLDADPQKIWQPGVA